MSYSIIIDTETTMPFKAKTPIASKSLVYDFGFAVFDDDTFEVVEEYSYVISDTFFCDELMQNAYFKDKIPSYLKDIHNGKRKCVTMIYAALLFKDVAETYNVKHVYAYNCTFDKKALNNSIAHATNNEIINFFGNLEVRDIWKPAQEFICNTCDYVNNFAIPNGAVTARGNVSSSAENVYRYLTDDNAFIESHTALDDCQIELFILAHILRNNIVTDFICGSI